MVKFVKDSHRWRIRKNSGKNNTKINGKTLHGDVLKIWGTGFDSRPDWCWRLTFQYFLGSGCSWFRRCFRLPYDKWFIIHTFGKGTYIMLCNIYYSIYLPVRRNKPDLAHLRINILHGEIDTPYLISKIDDFTVLLNTWDILHADV